MPRTGESAHAHAAPTLAAGAWVDLGGILGMRSRRMLGLVALFAIVIAAISFTVVDISIAGASGCVGATAGCVDEVVPVIAISFAALGLL